jgi:hypothetical protein
MPIGNHRGVTSAPFKSAQPSWQRTLPTATTRQSDVPMGFQRTLALLYGF